MISLCGRYYIPSEYEIALSRRNEVAKAAWASRDLRPVILAEQELERTGNRLFGERKQTWLT